MLDIEAAKTIGIKACIDKIGRDFVITNQDFATAAYGEIEDGVYCFVGVDDERRVDGGNNSLVLDSCSKFKHYASCKVNLSDGLLTFVECVPPEQFTK